VSLSLYNAAIYIKNTKGQTAFDIAKKRGRDEIAQLLETYMQDEKEGLQ